MPLGSLPRYRPQLAELVREPPEGNDWAHEIKYDGYRIGLLLEGGRVRLESRREIDWTARFSVLVEAVRELRVRSVLIDGEAVIVLPDGRTSFQALQNSFEGGSRAGLAYYAFDLLWLDGQDLTKRPLSERKAELERVLGPRSPADLIRYSQHVIGGGSAVFSGAAELGAEGIVSKRLDSHYLVGRRGGWLKTKCLKREEFVIGGFTEPEGKRAGVGALLLGQINDAGELVFAGKVGTGPGFTAKYLTEVRRALETIEQAPCPFVKRPPRALVGARPHWVRPVLRGTVEYVERTDDGHVRHSSFQGFVT